MKYIYATDNDIINYICASQGSAPISDNNKEALSKIIDKQILKLRKRNINLQQDDILMNSIDLVKKMY